ncbi:hypothetical protein ART_2619 [Arthrobacter sp. PAMC 25486]|uniref:hypothetical protein n=1 Tax=Arthrobacter sp. PAMC 25486 TaxID=1494608 RepID=UPI000535F873|nr:hypothetical protein [Arthrobacter sp. PAMC 25486]AIY02218.1 hypothetical protein ART_2619 [Arthrobacter sp. PAMC 25486]
MKSRLTSASVATVLAAALLLAPGLSPAQASTSDLGASGTNISDSSLKPGLSLGNGAIGGAGNTATTYGMWFVPCNIFGFRMC